jgi:hypothetical protein
MNEVFNHIQTTRGMQERYDVIRAFSNGQTYNSGLTFEQVRQIELLADAIRNGDEENIRFPDHIERRG